MKMQVIVRGEQDRIRVRQSLNFITVVLAEMGMERMGKKNTHTRKELKVMYKEQKV